MKTLQHQTVKLPDGRIAERNSVHRYFYVVACWVEKESRWGALSWHMSHENAMTQMESRWKLIYPKMTIVPVIENMHFVP